MLSKKVFFGFIAAFIVIAAAGAVSYIIWDGLKNVMVSIGEAPELWRKTNLISFGVTIVVFTIITCKALWYISSENDLMEERKRDKCIKHLRFITLVDIALALIAAGGFYGYANWRFAFDSVELLRGIACMALIACASIAFMWAMLNWEKW